MTPAELSPEERRVVELFTPEELEALRDALGFAIIAAHETGQTFSLDLEKIAGVEWTPEKRDAYDSQVKALMQRLRGDQA